MNIEVASYRSINGHLSQVVRCYELSGMRKSRCWLKSVVEAGGGGGGLLVVVMFYDGGSHIVNVFHLS